MSPPKSHIPNDGRTKFVDPYADFVMPLHFDQHNPATWPEAYAKNQAKRVHASIQPPTPKPKPTPRSQFVDAYADFKMPLHFDQHNPATWSEEYAKNQAKRGHPSIQSQQPSNQTYGDAHAPGWAHQVVPPHHNQSSTSGSHARREQKHPQDPSGNPQSTKPARSTPGNTSTPRKPSTRRPRTPPDMTRYEDPMTLITPEQQYVGRHGEKRGGTSTPIETKRRRD